MPSSKKDKTVSIKMTEHMKNLVDEQAETENRPFASMAELLIAEALHARQSQYKFNVRHYR